MEPGKTFTLDELAAAAGDVNPRTIRYYIQLGLLDPPQGQTRAARYTVQHLARLVQIKSLTEQGLSLERVAEVLAQPPSEQPAAVKSPRPGEVSVRTHIFLAPGVDLVIDPARASLSAGELRRLTRALLAAYERHQASPHDTEQ
jgi:DNA-binding transcriptional MerR regulator